MISFMVIGLPRSATAWMANLLTTDTSLCFHEALMDHSLEELDAMNLGVTLGISETSLIFEADRVNAHPAKKLVIHRPLEQVNASLRALGLPEMTKEDEKHLESIQGHHIQYNELHKPFRMQTAFEHLGVKFDRQRFEFLCKLNVQNQDAISRVKEMV